MPTAFPRPPLVLIAEDEPEASELIAMILRGEGCEVIHATTAGLGAARSNSDSTFVSSNVLTRGALPSLSARMSLQNWPCRNDAASSPVVSIKPK